MTIFISYRREDSQDITDRIYDRLAVLWGKSKIFKDVNSIQPGADFLKAIADAVSGSQAVLVMIGRHWAVDASGLRRIDEPGDLARIEVEIALAQGKYIIPILVGRGNMPRSSDLPSSIKELAFRQALSIGPDPKFGSDIERLHEALLTLRDRGSHEGYCYLNRQGIDELSARVGIPPSKDPSYQTKVMCLLARLDTNGLLSTATRPGERQFVLLTSHFSFIDDDKSHISFRSDANQFKMNMSKLKSTFWPDETKMARLSHVRIALSGGVDLQVFGEWYAAEYLRPHAASIVGYNLRGLNTLF